MTRVFVSGGFKFGVFADALLVGFPFIVLVSSRVLCLFPLMLCVLVTVVTGAFLTGSRSCSSFILQARS